MTYGNRLIPTRRLVRYFLRGEHPDASCEIERYIIPVLGDSMPLTLEEFLLGDDIQDATDAGLVLVWLQSHGYGRDAEPGSEKALQLEAAASLLWSAFREWLRHEDTLRKGRHQKEADSA